MSPSPINSSLKDRVLRAGGWTIGGYLVAQLIRLGSNLIMTRLLVPQMFGLMAIVYVVFTGFALFSDLGLRQIIVQSPRGEDPDFLNTVWVVQIVRGVLILLATLLLCAALPVIGHSQLLSPSSVYADPLLPTVIAVYTSVIFIGGFESTKLTLARRMLALALPTKIEIISQILSVIVMIAWAALERSIWSLVAGGIVGCFVSVVLSHLLLPGPSNRWAWDASAFKEIITFGKWIIPSSVFGFFVMNGDRLLLGGVVNAELLGLYSIALLFSSSLQALIHYLMGIVAFPALSEVARENPAQLQATYYKFRVPFDVAMLSASGALFAFGSSLIRILYDSRYFGAGPILEILALGMISGRYYLVINCFTAMGKTRINTMITAAQLLSFYVLVPVAYWRYQFDGAVWAIALGPLLGLPVMFYFKKKQHLLDVKKELLVLPFFFAGAIAGELLSLLVK